MEKDPVSKRISADDLKHVLDLAGLLGRQGDYDEMIRILSTRARHILQSHSTAVMMLNPRTHRTLRTIVSEEDGRAERNTHAIRANVTGWVIRHGTAFCSSDIRVDHRFRKDVFEGTCVRSVIGAPLIIEGVLIGCLVAMNSSNDSEFSEKDLWLLERIAEICAPFLSNSQRLLEYFRPRLPEKALLAKYRAFGLIGQSRQFIGLLKSIESVARCDVRVLLEGQSGTGKELVARAIHRASARCDKPFVAVDCGTISEHLAESELFGHMEGAFTGATHTRRGLIQEAHKGTLFLDEITNLRSETQAKLLRLLQEGEVRPVGSNRSQKVDVRIISASSSPLKILVETNQFREDLYFRLNVYPIHIPQLSDRPGDIVSLAGHFAERFSRTQGKKARSFQTSLVKFLQERRWPGNIRELENIVECLVTMAPPDMEVLDVTVLPPELSAEFRNARRDGGVGAQQRPLDECVAELEERLIRRALLSSDWNQSGAARALGISERTMRYKMEKLGVTKSHD